MDMSIPMELTPGQIATSPRRGAAGKAHGTFGELLQGALPGEEGHFLVTLPINRFSYASFYRNDHARHVQVRPAHKTKSRDLALALLEELAPGVGGELVLRGDLEEGKGCSSSSADMVATARAIAAAIDKPLSLQMLLDCMGRLEPTDGVMFDSCIVFYHRRVFPGQELGPPPSVRIIAIDEGGTIDTIHYNHSLSSFTASEVFEYRALLDQLIVAFDQRDLPLLGSVCSRGAELNQGRNPKRLFEQMRRIAEDNGALGVVVTHSGTFIGIMLSHYDDQFELKEAYITTQLSRLGQTMVFDSLSYNKQGDKPW